MLRIILFAYAVSIGIETGAGLFTSMAVFPVWTASPEIVIGWKPTMPYFVQEGRFFMFGSSATTLLSLSVLFLNKRLPVTVRPWALGSSLTFMVVAAWTAAYFVPVQGRIHGDAGARCGISMKGVDIVVRGSVGHMSAFMAQRGRLVVCGDAGEALGDSIFETRIYVGGSVAGLGADCVEKELRDEHRDELRELLDAAGIELDPGEFRQIGRAHV